MELGWIVIVTLKLTRANILRLKESLIHLVGTNPLPSSIIFVVISVLVLVMILKNKNPDQ
jgi:hypothetical protein